MIDVDDRAGPRTLVGLGEECLLCDEPMGPGEVYIFVCLEGSAGITHEDCANRWAEELVLSSDATAVSTVSTSHVQAPLGTASSEIDGAPDDRNRSEQ